MRASHGWLTRTGLAAFVVVLFGLTLATSGAFAERLPLKESEAIKAQLRHAVNHDPKVVKKAWFLRKASLVNFVLPVTIRLLPASDGSGHFVPNDVVGNYATLDLGESLGQRAIGLGGQVNAEVRFHDAYDSDQIGNVDLTLLPDDAAVTSTSVGLLTNPDVSTRAAGQNHVDLLDMHGAGAGGFDLTWVDPGGTTHTAAGINAAGLDANALTVALQAAIGGNDVFATATGTGQYRVEFSGKYTAPPGGLNSIQVQNNATGAPISVANVDPGNGSNGGCVGFDGTGQPSDVDTLDKMQPSLTPGTNNVGPNWQWTPLGGTNERDVVVRTGPLTLHIDGSAEAIVPAGNFSNTPGDYSGNQAAGEQVGKSGGKANLFGIPVDGLGPGNSVDVTVNLATRISTILREVDASLPAPAGLPDETLGHIGGYFDCRQLWTGYVDNHLMGIHLVGALHISPAITADGRLRIAKVFLASSGQSRQALAACLVPYALFASGNNAIGDSAFTTADPWGGNPIGPDLIGGIATSAHFDPFATVDPSSSAAPPDVPCDALGGPLNRSPFNVAAAGATSLTALEQSGAVAAVAGDLTVQRLVGEVIIGHFPQPPPFDPGEASASLVAGVRVTPGKAGVVGKTGCVAKKFDVTVKGNSIAKVVFTIDGKTVDRFPNVIHNSAKLRVNPLAYKFGVHRLVAKVTFASGSRTKGKTLRLTFQRCGQKLVKPQFTG